jgi:hypothetical protein
MGQHVWLLLATVGTELLVIIKWSEGQYPAPLPNRVKWAWEVGGTLLVLYPAIRVRGLPSTFLGALVDVLGYSSGSRALGNILGKTKRRGAK